MIHDLLDEDPVYLAIMQKGREKGWAEGLRQGWAEAAVILAKADFADLETLARAKISAIGDMERLRQLVLDLHRSHTQEEVERVLLALSE